MLVDDHESYWLAQRHGSLYSRGQALSTGVRPWHALDRPEREKSGNVREIGKRQMKGIEFNQESEDLDKRNNSEKDLVVKRFAVHGALLTNQA